MKSILQILVLYMLCMHSFAYAQELPPIEKYTTEDYGGDNQNWMISQSSNKYIYVANNGGLLEYNGENWRMYPSPNNTIIRAINVIGDRIYMGCFKDFGYWTKDTIGNLNYYSLAKKLKGKAIDNENIWNIRSYKEWILFQSQKNIYFYNTISDNFKIINSKNTITKIFIVNNSIYYHIAHEGLFKVEHGKPQLIIDSQILKNDRVINIFDKNNQLLIQTHKSGFYLFDETKLSLWKAPINRYIKRMSIFNSIQLKDGSYILGTISNGIIYMSSKGEVMFQINQKNGLSNNTALSLFEDIDNNVWVGLDNGINCINIESPIRLFNDYDGVLGTVYSSIIFDNYLYLGTNQGLFYKKLNIKDSSFKFIKGTSGQVWNLFLYKQNELFCAHHNGTFTVIRDRARLIASIPGTWNIKQIPNKPDHLLQGNYNGLFVLHKKNGAWKIKNKIIGFDDSARYFEINKSNQVWVSHGYKGVFKITLDDNLKIKSTLLEPTLPIGQNSSLIKYKNDILYAYKEGVFKYDTILNTFAYDSILSPLIEKHDYQSGKLVVDKKNKLWGFSKNNISYLTTDNLTNKPKIHKISIPSHLRKGMVGYENISLIKNEAYLLGTENGYLRIDLSKVNNSSKYTIILTSTGLKNIGSDEVEFNQNIKGEFEYKPGLISFKYSVPEYEKFSVVKYQYKLIGNFNQWSEWSIKSIASFDNLSFGDYTFKVRAKVGNKLSKNVISYSFKVNKPWYLSNTAIVGYLILFLLLIALIHRAYRKYYHKQLMLKQSANEELIVRIKNEKLKQDIESKNRELAISTMSIIKKNEVLSSIKKELKKNKGEPNNVSSILKLIDANINNTKDWQFFEEAFNNADKHFLDKIKEAHPNLTPNDLRFCAYLRLNLSSKEIAPLLNISVRSVEIKRYRLRKKMNLMHSQSLVKHILDI